MNETKTAPSDRARQLRNELLGPTLSLDEVAYILDLDVTTITRYLRAGTLGGFQLGRTWHVTEADVRAYVQASIEARVQVARKRHERKMA